MSKYKSFFFLNFILYFKSNNDRIKNNKTDKFINLIVRKFDIIGIVANNNDYNNLDNSKTNKTDKILAKFKKPSKIIKN